jgi:hypothetical protein
VRSGDEETKRLKTWVSADPQEEAERLIIRRHREETDRETHTHTQRGVGEGDVMRKLRGRRQWGIQFRRSRRQCYGI